MASKRGPIARIIVNFMRKHGWIVVLSLFALTNIVSIVAYIEMSLDSEPLTVGLISEALYFGVLVATLNSADFLQDSTGLLMIAQFLGLLFIGVATYQTAISFFYGRIHALRILRFRNHIVICGLGNAGIRLARELSSLEPHARRRYDKFSGELVVIDRDETNPNIAEARYDLGIPVLTNDAIDGEVLERARIEKANSLILLCDDSTDMTIAQAATEYLESKEVTYSEHPRIHIHIERYGLWNQLNFRRLEQGLQTANEKKWEFFNIKDTGPFEMLQDALPSQIRDSLEEKKGVGEYHALVVGFGAFGIERVRNLGLKW
jgi:hypothetical protein